MRAFKLLPVVAVLALGLACSPPPPPVETPPDQLAPEFLGGGQLGPDGGVVYPGPYGVGTGSVIPNWEFLGFPRASIDHTQLQRMQFGDFYNPTNNGVYPAGSPYEESANKSAGVPTEKPRALLIDRSAVWCPPCNEEAENVLPGKRLKYAPMGGEILVAIDDGADQGIAAVQSELDGWVTRYHIDYPAVLNPNQVLSAIVGVDAYPGHIIVRTRDMKIVAWTAGVPDAAFWKIFDDTLAGKPVVAGD